MKKIFFTIITLFVYCNLFAYTQMHIYEDAGEFTFDADYIDSIKYVKENLKIDDDTTDKKYAITYLDDDGDTLKVDSLDYGSTVNYKPNKKWSSKFERYIYFNNWMPTITKVRSDAVYTAVYDTTPHSTYCIVFIDYKDSILGKGIAEYNYGWEIPENVPVKEKNLLCEYGYSWSCTYSDDYNNKIWKEILDSTFIKYVIVLKDDEGRKLSEKKGTYLYVPPSKIFVPYLQGWKEVSSWTRDNSLEAHDTIMYTAKFDNTEVSKLPESSLHSVFPISDTTSAYFSKGNLQYNAGDGNTHKTADSTAQGTWRFAERQYDYVGEENVGKDSTYNGWVDLFEWGSSGWKGTHDHDYVSLDTAQCRNADWGVYNAISNGGDEPGLWRVLSYEEWAYLLNRSNWAFAKVGKDSTQCLVIFPSNFVAPDTMNIVYASTSDKNDFDESYEYAYKGGPGINKSNTNIFSDEEFEKLEARGAVALPCAGLVDGDEGRQFNWYGNIWTSTHEGATKAIEIYFGSTFAGGSVYTDVKKSVRLVHEVE